MIFGKARRPRFEKKKEKKKRDRWRLKSSVVSKQFSSLSLPSLVPSPSAPRPPPHHHHHHHPPPMLLGGHVTLSALIGALRPFTHVRFFRRICQHSQPFPLRTAAYIVGAEPFPGLIKAKRVFQFRVIERVQHINMLGQHYQPVSLLRVIDDGPSTLAPTNILSGCVFFFA